MGGGVRKNEGEGWGVEKGGGWKGGGGRVGRGKGRGESLVTLA